ncbi:MAG: hypothetical protein IJT84_06200, partial [Clostridia bacterium]|nr:hypothetical protein [Clostridia bacterium]
INRASTTGLLGTSFKNGHIIINGGICNKKGKITYPKDVGVTAFSDIAFNGGYILVEKVTSDYSFTKKEFGIMNFSFDWVVEPSENLYRIIENSQNNIDYYIYNGYLYYSNDCIFNTENNLCLDIKAGKLSELKTDMFTDETDFWRAEVSQENSKDSGCLYFFDLFNNQKLKIEDKNLNMPNAYLSFRFTNNHCPIGFYNEESDTSYLTLTDKTGKYLFNPVKFSDRGIGKCFFDGETILATNLYSNENGINTWLTKMKTYDTKGNLLGEMTV